MTTSAQSGPNGLIPQEILDLHPKAPLIERQGEIDAWDNAEFRAAVKATNRTQIIIAGIVTDVCTAFLARSLRAEGYSVWADIEASGTTTKEVSCTIPSPRETPLTSSRFATSPTTRCFVPVSMLYLSSPSFAI